MKSIREIRQILSMAEGEHILRRYFVMNGFDGSLTALGIIIGAYIAKTTAITLILAGLGASIAMGVSGFWIAYLTERAERTRDIKELEEHMVANLDDTKLTKANFWTSLIISLVDGFSPFLFAFLAIVPFFFAHVQWIEMFVALIISMVVILVEVVILGLFLGAVSKENKIIYALKIIPAAVLVAGLTYLLELFTNI